MKLHFLLISSLLLLPGCIEYKKVAMPQKEFRKNICLNSVDYVKVQQVIDTGVLITLCQSCTAQTCSCDSGSRLYFWPRETKSIVDDQLLPLDEEQCLSSDGVFSYTNVIGATKTIRKVKQINEMEDNVNYEIQMQEKEEIENQIDWQETALKNLSLLSLSTLLLWL